MWSIDNQLEAKWRTGGIQHTSLLGLDYNEQRWERVQYAGNVSPLNLYQPAYGAPVVLGPQPAADVLEKPRQLGLYAQQHMKIRQRLGHHAGRPLRQGQGTRSGQTERRLANHV